MKVIRNPNRNQWDELCERPTIEKDLLESQVKKIIENVRFNGDIALKDYAQRFDKVTLKNLTVSEEEMNAAATLVQPALKAAIQLAQRNIETFHNVQVEKTEVIETMQGVNCWRKNLPIEKVGLYIPGGSAPLFSTILMLAIPAQIAGCKEIILCTPPDKNGEVNPAILYTANLVGVKKVFKIGGAQAIAAMAFGTETVPKVFKIFGPGNQFVTQAKAMVQMEGVAIDMPAGPSELLVIADKSSNPAFVAADLLSQAEHGADSQVILLSDNEEIVKHTLIELESQVKLLPRQEIAQAALKNSRAIICDSINECMNLSNYYAPEHLIICCNNPESLANKVTNAGSVFIGAYSCESAGDYASGTNHTLPTNGFARNYSGVSLDSFVKKITFQNITAKGIQQIGPAIEIMAEAEELFAHKNAVTLRLKSLENV